MTYRTTGARQHVVSVSRPHSPSVVGQRYARSVIESKKASASTQMLTCWIFGINARIPPKTKVSRPRFLAPFASGAYDLLDVCHQRHHTAENERFATYPSRISPMSRVASRVPNRNARGERRDPGFTISVVLGEHLTPQLLGGGNGALAINDEGVVVGPSAPPGNAVNQPFLWTKEKGMQHLPLLPGDVVGAGLDINKWRIYKPGRPGFWNSERRHVAEGHGRRCDRSEPVLVAKFVLRRVADRFRNQR